MIASTNSARIQQWLANNAAAASYQLEGALPDYVVAIVNRIPVVVAELGATLTAISVQGMSARLDVVSGVISALTALEAVVRQERARNANQLAILKLEGEVKKTIATLRGAFKNELAILDGNIAIELANLEADKDLELVKTLAPIERDGKAILRVRKLRALTRRGLQYTWCGKHLERPRKIFFGAAHQPTARLACHRHIHRRAEGPRLGRRERHRVAAPRVRTANVRRDLNRIVIRHHRRQKRDGDGRGRCHIFSIELGRKREHLGRA